MLTQSLQTRTLGELRQLVNQILCEYNQFVVGAFPLTERILVRAGEACGVYFCLHGPRAVRSTAIWENSQNTVLFYGATGERFQKIQLAKGPRLEAAVA